MYQDILIKEYIKKWISSLKVSKKGKKCPICGKMCVWRPKYLDKRLVDQLKDIAFYCEKEKTRAFVSREVFGDHQKINDFQKLHYWGLIQRTKTSGWWKITNKGVRFLKGEIQVPRKVFVSDNKVVVDAKGEPVVSDDMVRVDNAGKRWQECRSDYTLDYIIAPRKDELKEIDWEREGYPSVDKVMEGRI